jgi:hypothetical protein
VIVEDEAIEVEQYRWDAAPGGFRHSDRHRFARRRPAGGAVPRDTGLGKRETEAAAP